MEMKLIIEEQIGELNEGNLIYLGGFQDNLKHGRGMLFCKERNLNQKRLLRNLGRSLGERYN